MKKFLLGLMLIAGFPWMVSACGVGEKTADGYEDTPVQHAYEHWPQGEKSFIPFVFIDVRTLDEYDAGHIQGAMHIPLQDLSAHIAEIPHNKQVYVYCHSGRRSASAAKLLAGKGFTNIENVVGGFSAWKAAEYPVVP